MNRPLCFIQTLNVSVLSQLHLIWFVFSVIWGTFSLLFLQTFVLFHHLCVCFAESWQVRGQSSHFFIYSLIKQKEMFDLMQDNIPPLNIRLIKLNLLCCIYFMCILISCRILRTLFLWHSGSQAKSNDEQLWLKWLAAMLEHIRANSSLMRRLKLQLH